MSKRKNRSNNGIREKNIKSNQGNKLLAHVEIMHSDFNFNLEAFRDNTITLRINDAESINPQKIASELVAFYEYSESEMNQPEAEIRTFEEEGAFGLEIKTSKNTLEESLKYSAQMLEYTKKGLPSLSNGIINLVSKLTIDDVIKLNGQRLYPEDVIVYTHEDEKTIFYQREGYFMFTNSPFSEAIRKQFKLLVETRGGYDLFAKGIHTDLMNLLNAEIKHFGNRAEAFSEEGDQHDIEGDILMAFHKYSKAFYDLERARIVQTFILRNEKQEDKRIGFFCQSRENMHKIMIAEMLVLENIVRYNRDYNLLKRFIDRSKKIMNQYVNDMKNKSKTLYSHSIENSDEFLEIILNKQDFQEKIDDLKEYLDLVKMKRQDVDRLEHISMCEGKDYIATEYSTKEDSLADRLFRLMPIADPAKFVMPTLSTIIRIRSDPLYLRILPESPLLLYVE
ncbi:MAG: hypothetical protein ACMXYG_05710 [Candidatus Woesearchaeota archaeon]